MNEKRIREKNLQKFEMYLHEEEKSRNTVEKYMRDVRCFALFAGDREITKALVMEYKLWLVSNYAITSVNSMLAALNVFLRFCGWYSCCVKLYKVQRQVYSSEKKELTKAEYVSLIKVAERKNNERLSFVIQTICGTGIRVSELSFITVEAVLKGEAVVSCKGKTRYIFIVKQLRKKLLKYAKSRGIVSGPIFVTKNGKPLDRSNIWSDMKKLCKEAGVDPDKVFPHNFRHLFARTFYQLERDLAKLADILGHSSINTTRIYIMTTSAEHRRKMENMKLII